MAKKKKEEELTPEEETVETPVEETVETPVEETVETPVEETVEEVNPWEEKYNQEHDSYLRLAAIIVGANSNLQLLSISPQD